MELLPQNARPDVNAETMTVKARNLRAGPCRRDCSASDLWLLLLLLLLLLLGRRRSVMPPSLAWAPAPAAFIPLRAAKSVRETAGNTHFMMDAAPTSGCTHTLHHTCRQYYSTRTDAVAMSWNFPMQRWRQWRWRQHTINLRLIAASKGSCEENTGELGDLPQQKIEPKLTSRR